VSNKVNYLIYSHYHADHAGASSLFDKNVTRIGHEETRRVLLRDDDPARPPNEETFHDAGKAGIGGVIWRLRCVRWTRRSGGARPAGGYSPTATRPHTCAPPRTLDEHFAGRSPDVVATYRAFEAAARENGPMVVIPEKTRIAFQLRMSFAAVTLRKRWVDAHVVLARRLENARFRRIETFSTRNHLHEFRLEGPEEVDDEVARWLAEAYRVGRRDHLRERTSDDR
jgi:hypothetical protein